MKIEDKDIDKIFATAAQKETAPQFQPAYWEEMSAILSNRFTSKKGLYFWISGGLCAVGIIVFILFNQRSTNAIRYNLESTDYLTVMQITPMSNQKTSMLTSLHATQNISFITKGKLNEKSILSTTKNKTEINTTFKQQQNKQQNSIASLKDKETAINHSSVVPLKEMLSVKNTTPIIAYNNKNRASDTNTSIVINIKKAKEKTTNRAIDLKQMYPSLPIRQSSFTMLTHPPQVTLQKLESPNVLRYQLYLLLGGGIMENYKTKSPFQSGNFDLSVRIDMHFNQLSFRTGIGTQLTTNADLIVSKRIKSQEFGVAYQNDLSYQNLIDLYIPIELGYRFKSTSFGIGIQENFLLSSSLKLKKYKNKVLTSSENLVGYFGGLHRFTTQGYLWIEHQFTPHIYVGAKIGTNLSSRIKKGVYFNNSATTNPLYGQITLRFNLLK